MVASSEEKKVATEDVNEEILLNNSAIKFLKKEEPTPKGESLGEKRRAFCCKRKGEPPPEQPHAFYCKALLNSKSPFLGGVWYKNEEVGSSLNKARITGSNGKDPSFTLVAGTGNGTLNALSIDYGLYSKITNKFEFPAFFSGIIEQVVSSIHGVIISFLEQKDGQSFLLIIFSAPKSPVRELFCAMRINLATASTTCLLFDNELENLLRLLPKLEGNFQHKPIWQNPIAVLVLLARECGLTSEIKRQERDDEILSAEAKSESTLWTDPSKIPNEVPDNFYDRIKALHVCSNTLTFIDHAVAFEIDVWNFLKDIMTAKDVKDKDVKDKDVKDKDVKDKDVKDKDMKDGRWLEESWMKDDRQFITDTVSYEIWRIKGRKLQIAGLQDRVKVAQSVVENLIARQEGTRTLMISILAALYASASLVASIFSCGIFHIQERAWVIYVASTGALMFVTVAIAIFYFIFPIIWLKMKGILKGEKAKGRSQV